MRRMSEVDGGTRTPYDVPPVPASAWALGWSFVVGQVLALARRGPDLDSVWPVSMVLGAVLVVLVAHGVMRARRVRFWFVVLVMVLAPVAMGIGLASEPTVWRLASLLLALVQLALLRTYARTAWFAWQETRPAGGPSLVPILAVAALVGVMGGLLGVPSDGVSVSVNIRF